MLKHRIRKRYNQWLNGPPWSLRSGLLLSVALGLSMWVVIVWVIKRLV